MGTTINRVAIRVWLWGGGGCAAPSAAHLLCSLWRPHQEDDTTRAARSLPLLLSLPSATPLSRSPSLSPLPGMRPHSTAPSRQVGADLSARAGHLGEMHKLASNQSKGRWPSSSDQQIRTRAVCPFGISLTSGSRPFQNAAPGVAGRVALALR